MKENIMMNIWVTILEKQLEMSVFHQHFIL